MEVQIPFVNFYANGKSSHKHAIREDIASEIVNVSEVSLVPLSQDHHFTFSLALWNNAHGKWRILQTGFVFVFVLFFPS